MKRLFLLVLVITLLGIVASPVFAAGEGTIRISPALPVMLTSPATFQVWIEGAGQPPTTDPHILLVMTQASWTGLTGNVVVDWTGGSISFSSVDFTAVNTGYVLPSGTTPGGRYTVASLQDRLGVSHSDNVYYAHGSFLSGLITQTPQTFTITASSTNLRMLVYAIGKNPGGSLFNNKVPPTIPGFVVPELGPALLALASLSAFALYAVKRRKA